MHDPKKAEVAEANLTQAQLAALPLLAGGAKKKDAAASAGVCPQTVSEWLREPIFRSALSTKREALIAVAAARLGKATDIAVDTVVKLMEVGSEATKLRAAMYILDRVLQLQSAQAFSWVENHTVTRDLLIALGVKC